MHSADHCCVATYFWVGGFRLSRCLGKARPVTLGRACQPLNPGPSQIHVNVTRRHMSCRFPLMRRCKAVQKRQP